MKTSARFVDLRFARYCQENGFQRICIAREKGWMRELNSGKSIFDDFTTKWPPEIVKEAQSVAGFRFLPSLQVLAAEENLAGSQAE